ncbi:MAG: aminodeoxychorismate/anthranilate synthase component II [Planctomycetes bacterium]|nr:aminodeoxychorismate/anthranilate synthase component II [Planctomycetota bacterium]
MILLVDNYDSFTWNLYQSMAGQGAQVEVCRNDAVTLDEVADLRPSGLVISPGPGRPSHAGITPQIFGALPDHVPILGVCLGHQALCEHYGAELEVDPVPVHGKSSIMHHDDQGLFCGLPNPLPAGRYHSLRAKRETVPDCLLLTAWTEDGLVMGVRHQELPHFGIQFHPESILTPTGDRMIGRFLAMTGDGGEVR